MNSQLDLTNLTNDVDEFSVYPSTARTKVTQETTDRCLDTPKGKGTFNLNHMTVYPESLSASKGCNYKRNIEKSEGTLRLYLEQVNSQIFRTMEDVKKNNSKNKRKNIKESLKKKIRNLKITSEKIMENSGDKDGAKYSKDISKEFREDMLKPEQKEYKNEGKVFFERNLIEDKKEVKEDQKDKEIKEENIKIDNKEDESFKSSKITEKSILMTEAKALKPKLFLINEISRNKKGPKLTSLFKNKDYKDPKETKELKEGKEGIQSLKETKETLKKEEKMAPKLGGMKINKSKTTSLGAIRRTPLKGKKKDAIFEKEMLPSNYLCFK